MLWLSGLLVTLAWGAGAFGSPYPWAYVPLLILSSGLGLAGLWAGRDNSRTSSLFIMSLCATAVAVGAQLLPLSNGQLSAISPHAIALLKELNVTFSMVEMPSHPLSIDPSRTQLGLACFASFALLILGTARFLTRESANRLAGGIVVLGVALAIIGIVQRATFNGKIYGFWEPQQGGSPFGPFVNKNHFAGWMLMGLPVALGFFLALVSRGMQGKKSGVRNFILWFSSEQASRALLTGFSLLLMVLSLVLTMSRSGIMAGAAALVIAGTVTARHQTGTSRRTLAIGYLMFLVLAVILWVGMDQIAARFAEMDPSSINERPAIWADAIRVIKDFWVTGTGLNTYGVDSLVYQTAAPGKHVAEAHNDYLQLAAEGGLLVCTPIFITILAFGWEVRRRLREDVGSIWWLRMGAVIGLIAIAFQSMVEFSLQMPGNAALFAVVAGLAIHDGRRL